MQGPQTLFYLLYEASIFMSCTHALRQWVSTDITPEYQRKNDTGTRTWIIASTSVMKQPKSS